MTSNDIQIEALKVDIMSGIDRVKVLHKRFIELGGKGFYCENCEKWIEGVHFCSGKQSGGLLNTHAINNAVK